MDGYDEDVTENPFYKAFLNKSKSFYNTAAENRWMICIPRKGTTSRSHYVTTQFETHVLKPVEGDENNHYQTYNEKEVRISGSIITTTKGFSDVKTIRILFEETFFNIKKESYHILCIEQPLEGGAFSGIVEPVTQNLETLQNCIEFLWAGTGNRRSRKKVDDVISLFNSTYQRLETESIRHAMDAASAVFTRAMQTALKEPHLRRPALSNKAFMDNVKVAIETYVTHGLHKRIFKGLCSFLASQDAELNKITRNLADLQVKDLGVKPQLCKNIPRAKKILSNLNKFSTPLEKLYVLKLTVMSVSEVKDPSDAITADDLLPVLVFLVVKSEIPNWLANLTYMYNFHFSKSKNDEFQFYLSSVEAATEYVRSKKLNHLIGLSHTQRQKSLDRLFQRLDSTERSQGPSPVELLFEEIRNGNADNVIRMLSKGKEIINPVNEQLCHPLCSCDSCERLMASKRNDPMAVTVFSRDDIGSTVLHSAAEFDQENILFQLIKLGAVVNATNYHGSTPLHLACLRGHKKAAMMLIHYGANLNAADNDSNTPLHLAAVNGHEKVTEGLVLTDSHHDQKLDINAANENGDTPLHIGARWGFANLVTILLENGASIEARNKKKETPLNCSANLKIQELLTKAIKAENAEQNYIYVAPSEQSPPKDGDTTFPGEVLHSPKYPGGSPRTIRKQKQLHSLLKVISDGDVEMVKLKLGLTQENDLDFVDTGSPEVGLCHPLCQCQKCSGLQKEAISEPLNQIVNMANEDGVTCLHIAALHGYDRIVALLLKRGGAVPNCRTKDNQKTPLHFACQYNHVACVSYLLKHGARIDIKDASGNTPLHFCCTNGHISPAILLLQHGANANISNKRGNSPLHESARWNCPDLISLLLHYGASTKSRNKAKLTPLQYAQHDEVIEILQKAEKELDEENPDFFKVKEQQLDGYSLRTNVENRETKTLLDKPITEGSDSSKRHDPVEPKATSRISSASSSPDLPQKIEVDALNDNSANDKRKMPRQKQRKTTVAALFEAFEEDDIEKLRSLASGVQNFDRKRRLRRVSTIDKSEPFFDHHLAHILAIQHFDSSSLHHVTFMEHSNNTSVSDEIFEIDEQFGVQDENIKHTDDTTASFVDERELEQTSRVSESKQEQDGNVIENESHGDFPKLDVASNVFGGNLSPNEHTGGSMSGDNVGELLRDNASKADGVDILEAHGPSTVLETKVSSEEFTDDSVTGGELLKDSASKDDGVDILETEGLSTALEAQISFDQLTDDTMTGGENSRELIKNIESDAKPTGEEKVDFKEAHVLSSVLEDDTSPYKLADDSMARKHAGELIKEDNNGTGELTKESNSGTEISNNERIDYSEALIPVQSNITEESLSSDQLYNDALNKNSYEGLIKYSESGEKLDYLENAELSSGSNVELNLNKELYKICYDDQIEDGLEENSESIVSHCNEPFPESNHKTLEITTVGGVSIEMENEFSKPGGILHDTRPQDTADIDQTTKRIQSIEDKKLTENRYNDYSALTNGYDDSRSYSEIGNSVNNSQSITEAVIKHDRLDDRSLGELCPETVYDAGSNTENYKPMNSSDLNRTSSDDLNIGSSNFDTNKSCLQNDIYAFKGDDYV